MEQCFLCLSFSDMSYHMVAMIQCSLLCMLCCPSPVFTCCFLATICSLVMPLYFGWLQLCSHCDLACYKTFDCGCKYTSEVNADAVNSNDVFDLTFPLKEVSLIESIEAELSHWYASDLARNHPDHSRWSTVYLNVQYQVHFKFRELQMRHRICYPRNSIFSVECCTVQSCCKHCLSPVHVWAIQFLCFCSQSYNGMVLALNANYVNDPNHIKGIAEAFILLCLFWWSQ
jgi:hypothetical protein